MSDLVSTRIKKDHHKELRKRAYEKNSNIQKELELILEKEIPTEKEE